MTRASLMSLTAELVAKVQRFEPDDGPRPEIPQLDDVDFGARPIVRLEALNFGHKFCCQ